MSLRSFLVPLFGLVMLSSGVFAQPPQQGTQEGRSSEWKGDGQSHRRMGRHLRLRAMRDLNLTEAQRQQHREILKRYLGSTRTQREELFKLREKRIDGTFTEEDQARAQALRQEIRGSMLGIRTEMENVLTGEQRAKLDQLKAERKARREEMRERRRELRERRDLMLR